MASRLLSGNVQEGRVMMKTFALALCALVLVAGAVPFALAQDSSNQPAPAASPSVGTPSNPAQDAAPKTPEAKSPDSSTKVDIDIKARAEKGDDAGSASPRSGDMQRTGFFGLSPTAAIIVSVAVLLVVILAIVAMTQSSGNTTYIDRTDRRV